MAEKPAMTYSRLTSSASCPPAVPGTGWPQVCVLRPLYKLELPNQHRLERHSAIFAAVRSAPQRPAFFSGRIAKGHSLISSGLSFLNSSTRDTGVNPFRVRRRVGELSAVIIADNQCIEILR
jgi:hypothetical protein